MNYSTDEMNSSTAEEDQANGIDNFGFQPDLVKGAQDEKTTDSVQCNEQSKGKRHREKYKEDCKDDGGDIDILCGIGSCKPSCMQCCKNMFAFSVVFSFSGLVTSALNAYITSQITTLERHFNFSSSVSGVLLSCNDLGYLTTTLFMSYYTRRVHIPRAMAMSTILYGLSGILCAVAFFGTRDQLSSPPKNSDHAAHVFFTQTCQNFTTMTNSSCTDASGGIKTPFGISDYWKQVAIAILAVGMILQGVAKSPRQPFVITYIDDNVSKTKTTMYLGGIIGLSFLGPALAFALGAVFSGMYITLEETNISPRDPRWLGAWWMGFVIFGAAGLVVGLPLIFFPKRMQVRKNLDIVKPKKNVDQKRMQKYWQDIKGILKAVLHLALNPVYVCLTLSHGIGLMGGSGMMSFFTKYLETQFMITVSQSSITLGIMNVVIACVGTAIGGCMTARLKLSPLTCLRFIIGVNVVVTGIFALGLVVGCDKPDVSMGLDTNSSTNQTISQCVLGCNCDDTNYFPICGNDGNNYFSPCHAGCLSMEGMTFTNCSCLAINETQTATAGLCMSNCKNMYPYLVLISIGGFITTMTMMPSFIVSIRCVKEEEKPFAIGLSAFTGTLIGWFPGPVIFGSLVDSTCMLWTTTCGSVGACARYDTDLFRLRFHGLIIGLRIITVIFLVLAMIFAVCSKTEVFQPHLDEVAVTAPAKDNEQKLAVKKTEAGNSLQTGPGNTETYI